MKMAAHDGQVPGIKYGTVQYLAPEVLNTHIMTKKADVYSFGIIMWEVWHSRLFAEFYNNEKRKRKQCVSPGPRLHCMEAICLWAVATWVLCSLVHSLLSQSVKQTCQTMHWQPRLLYRHTCFLRFCQNWYRGMSTLFTSHVMQGRAVHGRLSAHGQLEVSKDIRTLNDAVFGPQSRQAS